MANPVDTLPNNYENFYWADIKTSTTTTALTRKVSDLVVSSTTDQFNLGTSVQDVSIIPFMRAKAIKFHSYGLKPNTRVYPFFDDEYVGGYCVQTGSNYTPKDNWPVDDLAPILSDFIDKNSTPGTVLTTNADGEIWGIFYLPNNDHLKFSTGTKEFKLTDNFRNSDSTTSSSTTYSASGLNVIKQGTILSVEVPEVSVQSTKEGKTVVTSNVTARVIDPIAQSFRIDLNNDDIPGLFVTSIDLYFNAKDTKNGAIVEIRPMAAGGQPDYTVLPFSRVRLPASSINVASVPPLIPTNFKFDAPVYLQNNQEYCFVVYPESNNPGTVLWTSKLGETDISTGARITTQPFAGVLFVSSNAGTWTAEQLEDIMFKLYRAKFDISTNGIVTFENNDREFMAVANVSTTGFKMWGEEVRGDSRFTIGSVVANSSDLSIGMSAKGATSHANGQITYISGSNIHIGKVTPNKDFVSGETISFKTAGGGTNGSTTVASTPKYARGTVIYYDERTLNKIKLHIDRIPDSNKTILAKDGTDIQLAAGDTLTGQITGAYCTISEIENIQVNTIDLEPSFMFFNLTNVDWYYKSATADGSVDKTWIFDVNINNNTNFPKEKAVYSFSNERSTTGGEKTLQMRGIASSATPYLSPLINKNRNNAVIVANRLNDDNYGEGEENTLLDGTVTVNKNSTTLTGSSTAFLSKLTPGSLIRVDNVVYQIADVTNNVTATLTNKALTTATGANLYRIDMTGRGGGNSYTRYFTQVVTLSDGQDAEDLTVYLTAYRPASTNIRVYYKIRADSDNEGLNVKPWVPLGMIGDVFSDPTNPADFREMQFIPGTSEYTPDRILKYINNSGIEYQGFKYYQIKIVLTGSNTSLVPRVGDLRAICLQK